MRSLKIFFNDLKQAAKAWSDDNVMLHASSLAYYTVFSIAPLLVIAMAAAGFVLGGRASQGQIFGEIQGLIGPSGASAVQAMVKSAASHPRSGVLATFLGVVTLVVGASGVFQQLQESLNLIWSVNAPASAGIWSWLKRRILTLSMIGVIAFLLLVSLVASAAIAAAGKHLGMSAVWEGVNFVISISVITVLFALVYRFLPDIRQRWRDLWGGSLVTAALFTVGKWVIGLYIGKSSVSSSYGAAGSLVVLLMWTYYSAMIFYFGAELVKAACLRRSSARPRKLEALSKQAA